MLCSHPPELRGPTPVSPSRVSVVPALVSGAVHRPPQGESSLDRIYRTDKVPLIDTWIWLDRGECNANART